MGDHVRGSVISVDMAGRDYRDVGVVTVSRGNAAIEMRPVELRDLGLFGRPSAEALAITLLELAGRLGATVIGLDGPQAWKWTGNGLEHSRVCERRLATQGKTGPPGCTKPRSYLGFISLCIETFDALAIRGWPRLMSSEPQAGPVAVETFPTAAWKALDLKPLPAKRKARQPEVDTWTSTLLWVAPINIDGALSHDQLQAGIAGLGLLALAEGHREGFEAVGTAPFVVDENWLEGFIVNPRRGSLIEPGGATQRREL